MTQEPHPSTFERLKAAYLMPFRALAAALRLSVQNRQSIREFTQRPRVAGILKYGMMITLLTWLAVALLNREEDDRLAEAMKGLWPALQEEEPRTAPADR